MCQSIKKAFNNILRIPDHEWLIFESILKPVEFKKNDYVLKQGHICKGIYYLEKGVVRTYFLKEGKEFNKAFNFDNEFLREIESLSNNTPSVNYIQALEDSRLIFIDKHKLTDLYQSSSFFQTLGRKILEQLAITEQKYASLLAAHSPKDRYLQILKEKPEMITRVPLQHLASYMGISRESLSRIRKRIS